MPELPIICAGVIAFGVLMYVLLDGFDLGVGILFPLARRERDREQMVASIAPVWDGNETWLVFGGSVLFAAFPDAYAIALPAFYIPLMAMLVALILRGVAFEFRAKAHTSRWLWDRAFAFGSLLAALCQGFVLGGLIEGVAMRDREFAGGPFDWLSPFSALTAVGVLSGYGLLGATWLVFKTEGSLQVHARRWSIVALALVILAMAAVSIATPLRHAAIAERWFGGINLLMLAPVPVATALLGFILWRALRRGWEGEPFILSVGLFLMGFLGLAISLWPNIVPPDLTIFAAAAPPSSQIFVLILVALTLPMVLAYTAYAYWVFRGKVRPGEGYGHD
jgi:cytochrome bd ubiquinol oxidase subunit II